MSALSPFRIAMAVEDDARLAADMVADDLLVQGEGGSLGFLYVTDRLDGDLGAVLDRLRERTGVDHWIGTTGLGVLAGHAAAFNRPAVAAMIGTWPRGHVTLYDGVDDASLSDVGAIAATAIVHVDPRHPFEEELRVLSSRSSAYLIGGIGATRSRNFLQVADKVGRHTISGALLGPQIDVAVGVSQGCSPVGPTRIVTAVEGNLVRELDGTAPLKALLDDVATRNREELHEVLQVLHVGLPVPHCDTGDYVVRNIGGIDTQDGSMALGAVVEAGQPLFFCRRDRAAATQDLTAMARKLRGRVNHPRGALYVSCCARGPNLFDSADEEVALVQAVLGNVPLVGFYANGEIAGDRLYAYTGVLALF